MVRLYLNASATKKQAKPSSEDSVNTAMPSTLKRLDRDGLRWEVATKGAVYSVDLSEESCTCPHWTFRLIDKPVGKRRCKHVLECREAFTNRIILALKNNS